ncbi:hypothetical protein M4D76_27790 [Peribacillus frigoritolerans]|uniref:hypothetical protein n=1 Tax=Peribacillus frigoritolerans TaxID=450367 RepID=UPI0021A4348C|nr:hypothetical protein [Peribacillus frigoritolerans]MCT1392049.1 hypothetical protein [Peribacillus frigoritolerans]
MTDKKNRKMYFVHDLLLAKKEEAHKFDDGKPNLVQTVFVGCDLEDLDKSKLEIEKYQGWIFSDSKILNEELNYEKMGEF